MSRLVMAVWIALLSTALAKDEPAPDYLRFVEDAKGASLQTAITHFKTAAGVEVDLIGAIHVADKAYYTQLNERFAHYDAVLYELVGGPMPEGDLKERQVDSRLAWLAQMQQTMKTTLQLTGQLEGINYHVNNFVHADMTTDQFYEAKEQKNESFLSLLIKAWKVQSERADETKPISLLQLMEIMTRQDNANELKRLIGREFDSMEGLITGLEADGGTVIVGERNRVALEQLDREIAKGGRHLAIFFGAAHLPDMEKKLKARGFTKQSTEWLKAWDLPLAAANK